MTKKRVWGISYKLNCSDRYTGPCGIYAMSFRSKINPRIFSNRPVFFRTRKLAREEIERQKELCNLRVTYKIEPFILQWAKETTK